VRAEIAEHRVVVRGDATFGGELRQRLEERRVQRRGRERERRRHAVAGCARDDRRSAGADTERPDCAGLAAAVEARRASGAVDPRLALVLVVVATATAAAAGVVIAGLPEQVEHCPRTQICALVALPDQVPAGNPLAVSVPSAFTSNAPTSTPPAPAPSVPASPFPAVK
jgi:hypothetical protein